jgi:hypothetical protein
MSFIFNSAGDFNPASKEAELRAKVAALEAENAALKEKVADFVRHARGSHGTCSYEECDAPAVGMARGREYYYVDYDSHQGHPTPAWYCEKHKTEVADENRPEYHAHCPNCDCEFGVN